MLIGQVSDLALELDKRTATASLIRPYDDGGQAIPEAVINANLTTAYRLLMGMSDTPWGSLIVDSVLDRLEVSGIRTGNDMLDETLWGVWQANRMDSESKLAHRSALLDGRAHALVWADGDQPMVSLDDATQMIVSYVEGSRHRRTAALRRWVDDRDTTYATLYRPEGIYKFEGSKSNGDPAWKRREVEDEQWPLPNPLGVVPVVELAVNRKLYPGQFPFARGEYAHVTGLLDRINLLTFVGLIVALWMGFPLRGLLGAQILRDDDGAPIAPFDAAADTVFQIEDPEAKLAEFKAADRDNLAVWPELDQLATITKTPRHYFPMQQGMSNIAADTIRANEGGLHAKVTSHKSTLGESWEDVLRISGQVLDVEVPQTAELVWKDHESRSLAERADAASKLKDVLPAAAIMEKVLNATPAEIARWESQGAIGQLLAAAAQPAPAVEPAAV